MTFPESKYLFPFERAELATWSPDKRAEYEELAGKLEYDQGLTRADAERKAWAEMKRK